MLHPTHDARPAPTLERNAGSNHVSRDARANLGDLTPVLDGDSFRTRRDNFVAERQQAFWGLRGILKRQQGEKSRWRVRHNAAIQRSTSAEQTRAGNGVLIKEAKSKLGREAIHAKPAHEHWTEPWRITSVEQPGLSYRATMRERRIRGGGIGSQTQNLP